MSDPTPGHGPFDELAAGYALDALEPSDEQSFLQHARGCAQCSRALADFREVAAALADTAPPAEPSAQLGDRILAMARGDLDRRGDSATSTPAAEGAGTQDTAAGQPAVGDEPAATEPAHQYGPDSALPRGVRRLRPRGNRWLRPVSIAAAAVLIATGGIWGGLEATSSSPPHHAVFCARGCSEIALTAEGTHQVAGKVFVQGQSVWMQPTAMKPDDTADQIYVLWQLINVKHPLAIGSFDVRAGATSPIKVGSLAGPYHGTVAFAVSLEPGRTIPASPSAVAAIGDVTLTCSRPALARYGEPATIVR